MKLIATLLAILAFAAGTATTAQASDSPMLAGKGNWPQVCPPATA